MPNERSPRGRTTDAAKGGKPKQKTQPKPLGALRDEVRSDLVAERGQGFDANAVLAKYKHPVGAASKKTPECVARILYALELGMSLKKAAVLAGITFETLNEWRKGDSVFSYQIKRARIVLEERMLSKLAAHSDENLRAVTFALERICSPKKYGKKVKPIGIELLSKQPDLGEPGKAYRVCFEAPREEMNAGGVLDAE
jgi:hypothetical protein